MKNLYPFATLVLGPLALTGCATSQEVVPVAVNAPKKSAIQVSEIETRVAPVSLGFTGEVTKGVKSRLSVWVGLRPR